MRTDSVAPLARALLLGSVLGSLVAVPAFDLATGFGERFGHGDPQLSASRPDDPATRLDSAAIAASTLTRTLRPKVNELLLHWFAATPPQVIAARSGWLFYGGGLGEPKEPATQRLLTQRIVLLREFATVAGRYGVPTQVWLVPAKWRVYGEQLTGQVFGPARLALYQRIRAALRDAGLDAPDALAVLLRAREERPQELLFSADDTHLTAAGFAVLVRELGPALLGMAPALVRSRLDALPVTAPRRAPGDLLALLQLPAGSALAAAFGRPVPDFGAAPAHDAPGSELLLIGDSNLTARDAALPRLLQAAAAATVDARYAEQRTARLNEIVAEYAGRTPRLLLLAVGERTFATEW